MMCTVEVDRAALRMSDNTTVTGDAGLPATSLALNEQRLYWARADSAGVYAVDFSATDTLIIVSATESVSSVSTLSPGQQVIPGIDCSVAQVHDMCMSRLDVMWFSCVCRVCRVGLVCMSHACFHVTGLGLFACHMLVSMSPA